MLSFCRLCFLEDGVEDSIGNRVNSGVSVGDGIGLAKVVTFFVKVQKVVDPFKKQNSVGLSGVDPLINTTISFSSRVRSLICPF